MAKRAAAGGEYQAARVAELAEEVLALKRAYYAGKPKASDAAYDALEDELKRLAPEHPALAAVGGALAADLPKVAHDEPMLSLQKTYDAMELVKWAGSETLVGTVKVDGISISLIYEDGALKLAKTRGNGLLGEVVTPKVRWVAEALPRLSKAKPAEVKGELEIRGELYCTESNFLKISEAMLALGLERPTSPRNIVAGLLGRKTHIELARYFRFFAFSARSASGALALPTDTAQLKWLGDLGFALPFPETLTSAEQIPAYLERVKQLMTEDEIPIDGAVFSFDSLARQRALGNTSHHPRYKMSFKWQGQTAESVIQDITWATSRLGIVTPVAVIEPVPLSGAMITNITLHNAEHVRAFNLKAGDRIEIVRSGEVIPKFLQVIKAGKGDYAWPKACPTCGTKLEFDDVRLKCPAGADCPAQQAGAILNWIRCAEIDDLSDKRLIPLMDAGLVHTAADLYKLSLDDFYKIPQTKEKMAAKLYANIDRSRKLPLARFLNGLGIEGAGLTTWEKLLEEIPTLADVQAASEEQIAAIDGFAEKTAEQLVSGLKARKPLIKALLAAGVAPTKPVATRGDGPLSGKMLVITGALSRPRGDVEKAIKAAGGRVSGSVSKTTHAVVTEEPESTSTKMQKARQLGVPIWSEADLWKAAGLTAE